MDKGDKNVMVELTYGQTAQCANYSVNCFKYTEKWQENKTKNHLFFVTLQQL